LGRDRGPARYSRPLGRRRRPLRAYGPPGRNTRTSGCWCQYWHLRGKAYYEGWPEANRPRLEAQLKGGDETGLLAYVDDVPVGWCRLGPRETFERLAHSPRLARVDDKDVWSVVCFYVHPAAKRKGVASALLEAGKAHASAAGASILEGYAVRRAT
jgi:GNAT superfamily N-acetyltransferase